MPRDGSSGAYSRASAAYIANTIISETAVNAEMDDLATAMTASVAKDGQTTMTANLKMGGYKLTGMAVGSASDDSARYDQTVTSAMTTRGDIVQRGVSAPERLAIGAAGKILSSDGTDAAWGDGPLTTRGDLIVRGATGLDRLGVGAANAVLGSDGTDPVWVANVARTDTGNTFTVSQVMTGTDASLGWIFNKTGGASAAYYAQAAGALFGTTTNHPVNLVSNNLLRFKLFETGGLAANGLADPGNGGVNATTLKVNNVAIPLQKAEYTSAEIAITPASGAVSAHSLGATPKVLGAHLVCKVNDLGYTVGQKVTIPFGGASNGTTFTGVTVVFDATNLTYRIGSGAIATLNHATTGAAAFPTTASWRLVLYAAA